MKKRFIFSGLFFLVIVLLLVGGWWYGEIKENNQIKEYAYIYLEIVFFKETHPGTSLHTICTPGGALAGANLSGIEEVKKGVKALGRLFHSKDQDAKTTSYPDSRSRMKVVSISKKYNNAVVTVEVIMPPDNKKHIYKLPFERDVESNIWKVGAISIFDFIH